MSADVFYTGGMVMIVLILASLMFLEPFLALVGAARKKVALRGSQAATIAILNARREREKATASRRELETSSFEAYTHCGGCGKLDYHPMREPRPEMTDEEFQRAWKLDYCLQFSIPVGRRGVAAWLEHTFDVIRECSCGHTWGQR